MSMNEETKRKLSYGGFTLVLGALGLVIGVVLIEYSDAFIAADRVTDGLVLPAMGGLMSIGALLWLYMAWDVSMIRKELNDMRKEP